MIVAAVPVKDLVNAKQRLANVLTSLERRALARAMLADVLRALAITGVDRVWVVTRDQEVRTVAGEARAEVLVEDENRGHTAAVACAQAEAVRRGADVFLTVPGDVPCVGSDEIDALARAAGDRSTAVFAPSRSGRGTNGVALNPPDVMPLTFGEPSFDSHLAAARERGLQPRVLRLPRLALDVDDVRDLHALLMEGGATESGRLLASFGVAVRVATLAGTGRL